MLDNEYAECREAFKARVGTSLQTLSVDGWSTNDNRCVIGLSLDGQLVKVVQGQEKKTTEYMAKVALDTITELEGELDVTVVAIVTDGASVMNAMRRAVVSRSPHLLQYWCQAHLLHLVVCDFFKHAGRKATLASVVAVHKSFRNVEVC
jgi:hypothetical protein